jgi:hypothetical protein
VLGPRGRARRHVENPAGLHGDLPEVPADRHGRGPVRRVTCHTITARLLSRPAPAKPARRLLRRGSCSTWPARTLQVCARPHTQMPRPCTRVKERKGRGIHAFCTLPQPSLRVS